MLATSNPHHDQEATPVLNFNQYFRQQVASLQQAIDSLASPSPLAVDRRPSTDNILASLTKLSAELADASADLPSYDQRSYNQALKDLQDKLAVSQASHAPKPKFSFKSRKLASSTSEANSATTSRSATPVHLRDVTAETARDAPTPALAPPSRHVALSRSHSEEPRPVEAATDRIEAVADITSNAYVDLSSLTSSEGGDNKTPKCEVSNTSSSVINTKLEGGTQGLPYLTLNDIRSSFVFAPDVQGPVHITGVRDSVLVLSSHQLRMHNSHNVEVYLFCSSRPIIEDCTGIKFARLPAPFLPFITASATRANKFDQVDDFKWLRNTHSPNWRLLEATECKPDDFWQGILHDLQRLVTQPDAFGALFKGMCQSFEDTLGLAEPT